MFTARLIQFLYPPASVASPRLLPLQLSLPCYSFCFSGLACLLSSPISHLQFLLSINHFAYSYYINVLKTTVYSSPLPERLKVFPTFLCTTSKTPLSAFKSCYILLKSIVQPFHELCKSFPSELAL